MTRNEFIELHLNELAGMWLDAAVAQRSGAELALASRMALSRLRARLGVMYDQLIPPPADPPQAARPAEQTRAPQPSQNGPAQPQQQRRT